MHSYNTLPALAAQPDALAPQQIDKPNAATVVGTQSLEHLQAVDPSGCHNIWTSQPGVEGQLEALTFSLPGDAIVATALVTRLYDRANIYYSINEVRMDLGPTKAGKADIVFIRAVWVDIDPKQGVPLDVARAQIQAVIDNSPIAALASLVIDSGGGFQLIFLLREKLPASPENVARAEAINRGLAELFDGDRNACDASRILRLAGAKNYPDAKKLEKGRRIAPTSILRRSDVRVTLDQMAELVKPVYRDATVDRSPRINALMEELRREGYDDADDFAELPADLREKFLDDLDAHPTFRAVWSEGKGGDRAGDATGSGHLASLAQFLGRINEGVLGRYTVVDFARLAYVWKFSVQAGDDRDTKLNERQIARAWANVAETVATRDEQKIARLYETEQTTVEGNDHRSVGAAGAEQSTAAGAQLSVQVADASPKPPRIAFQSFHDVSSTALSVSARHLVKGLLDQGALAVMYGPSNVGKSFVALSISFHVAAGLPWSGMKVTKGTVVYIAAEGGAGVRKRVAALRRHYGRDDVDLQFFLSNVDLRRPDADIGPLVAAIIELGRPVILVTIDTLSRVMAGGDENSPVDMGNLVKNIDRLREATHAAVLAIHHSGRDVSRGARGHSLLRAAVDTEIEIADRQIVVTKQRDIDTSWRSGFDLPVITLGTDEDGAPITSCVLELVDRNARPSGIATPSEQVVLDALEDILSETPSRGAKAAEIVGYLRGTDRNFTLSGVRGHLKNLMAKGLAAKAGVDQWRPKAPKMSSATWFQALVESQPSEIVMAEAVACSVFD